MKEVYEGEETVSILIPNDAVVDSVNGYHILYDDSAMPVETEYALSYTEEPIGDPATYKYVHIDVSELSQWPTDFEVHLTYDTDSVIKNKFFVVAPYAEIDEIAVAGGFQTTDPQGDKYMAYATIREMESLARNIINSYTGRDFGREYRKIVLDGTDTDLLYSDEHITWIGLVMHDDEPIYSSTVGQYVVSQTHHGLTIIDDYGDKYGFPEGYDYTLIGIFGEEEVPQDITLAAKMLAVNYLCNGSGGTNKYVEQTKFGESQTKVNRLAFVGTGLHAVDLLLEKYRFNTMQVL